MKNIGAAGAWAKKKKKKLLQKHALLRLTHRTQKWYVYHKPIFYYMYISNMGDISTQ